MPINMSTMYYYLNVSSEGGVAGVRGAEAGDAGEAARLRSRRCCGLNHSG